MNETNKISNAPMILGIIGGIIGLPAAVCSGACAAGLSSLAENASEQSVSNTADTFMWIGLIAAILGLISAFLYKKNTKTWGILMIVAGLMSGITLVTFNLLSFVVCILFLIGGIISLTQKRNTPVIQ